MGENYSLDRESGLTARERQMLQKLQSGDPETGGPLNVTDAGRALGVSKQRAYQIAQSLQEKGAWKRPERRPATTGEEGTTT